LAEKLKSLRISAEKITKPQNYPKNKCLIAELSAEYQNNHRKTTNTTEHIEHKPRIEHKKLTRELTDRIAGTVWCNNTG